MQGFPALIVCFMRITPYSKQELQKFHNLFQ